MTKKENNINNQEINTQEVTKEKIETLKEFQENMVNTAEKFKSEMDRKEEMTYNFNCAERVIAELARQQEISFTHAAYAMADLYQKGAHLKNVQNRTSYINGLAITKQNINQAAIRLNIKITHRAMARALREVILNASKHRQIPGNLFAQYKSYLLIKNISLDEPTLEEHSYYCTDFHIDNPNTPLEVAKFLNTRTRSRTTAKRK